MLSTVGVGSGKVSKVQVDAAVDCSCILCKQQCPYHQDMAWYDNNSNNSSNIAYFPLQCACRVALSWQPSWVVPLISPQLECTRAFDTGALVD
jgi:hypothetical protein